MIVLASADRFPNEVGQISTIFTSDRISEAQKLTLLAQIQRTVYGDRSWNPETRSEAGSKAFTTLLVDAMTLRVGNGNTSEAVRVEAAVTAMFIAAGRDTAFKPNDLNMIVSALVGQPDLLKLASVKINENVHPAGREKLRKLHPSLASALRPSGFVAGRCWDLVQLFR
jgi:hypothetical protein